MNVKPRVSKNDLVYNFITSNKLEDEENVKIETYEPGEYIFEEGKSTKGIYTIESGEVKVTKKSVNGKSLIVRFAKKGSVLGYSSLMVGKTNVVSAITTEKSKVRLIPIATLKKVFHESDLFSSELINNISDLLGEAYQKMANLSYTPLKRRVAEILLLLSRSYEDDDQSPVHKPLKISRQDLAETAGAAKESTIRVLRELHDQGIVRIDGGEIKIEQPKELSDLAGLPN